MEVWDVICIFTAVRKCSVYLVQCVFHQLTDSLCSDLDFHALQSWCADFYAHDYAPIIRTDF